MLRVLIIDDELPIRDELAGYDWCAMNALLVGTAANGLAGLRLMRETHPDILLLDILMPGMNGLELLKIARVEFPRLITAILSHYGDYEYLRQAMQLGARDYVLKSNLCPEEMARLMMRLQPAEANPATAYRVEIQKSLRLIDSSLGEAVTQAAVAAQVGLSPKYFGRIFYEETGKKFQEYLLERRIAEAQRLLSCTSLKVYEVGIRVGIPNYRYFTQQFKAIMGYTPTDYKRREEK